MIFKKAVVGDGTTQPFRSSIISNAIFLAIEILSTK